MTISHSRDRREGTSSAPSLADQAAPPHGDRATQHRFAGEQRVHSAGGDAEQTNVPRGRIGAVDLLRGLMVVLMALDHTREYFSYSALRFDALDLSQTTSALFATRWITHLCAPTFVFLAGVSVQLRRDAGRSDAAMRRMLVSRGLWLIALEVTLIGFAFNFGEPFLFLQVIWAIGAGMIILAGLSFAPRRLVALVGIASIVGTAAAVALPPPALLAGWLWHLLVLPGPLTPLPGVVVYPLVPWTGVLLLGYAAGPLFRCSSRELRRRALVAGAGLLTLFVLLRLSGVGEPFVPSAPSGSPALLKLVSLVAVSKYPPSPQYLCVTLGVAALLLAALTFVRANQLPAMRAFGTAPFFTYVLHIYLIHTIALIVGLARGIPAADFTHFIESSAPLRDAGWGFGLPAVYAVWLLILALLAPLALRFAAFKRRGGRWWLSYL